MAGFWAVLGFLITICIVVVVHEGGHFFAARRLGFLIERFSVGVGPVVWRKYGKGPRPVEYAISAFPIGGYVKFTDDDPSLTPQERSRLFSNMAVWKRAVVVAAGPIMNFVLAVVLFAATGLLGVKDVVPYVGAVSGQAVEAGVSDLSLVKSVGDERVRGTLDFNSYLLDRIGDPDVVIVFETDGRLEEKHFDLSNITLEQVLERGGFVFPFLGLGITGRGVQVVHAAPEGAAAAAGVQQNDLIRTVNGERATLEAVIKANEVSKGRPVVYGIERVTDGELQTIELQVAPRRNDEGRWTAGISIRRAAEFTTVTLGPIESIRHALNRVRMLTTLQVKSVEGIARGTVGTESLSGPVGIAGMAGDAAKAGVTALLEFTAMISVAIGFMNLIPIPALDGGQLVFLGLEAIRRKPLPPRVMNAVNLFGFALILVLILFVTMNDINRIAG